MKTKTYDEAIRERRALLKSSGIGIQREEWEPHQRKGVSPPPLEKPYPEDGVLIKLKKFEKASKCRKKRWEPKDNWLVLETFS